MKRLLILWLLVIGLTVVTQPVLAQEPIPQGQDQPEGQEQEVQKSSGFPQIDQIFGGSLSIANFFIGRDHSVINYPDWIMHLLSVSATVVFIYAFSVLIKGGIRKEPHGKIILNSLGYVFLGVIGYALPRFVGLLFSFAAEQFPAELNTANVMAAVGVDLAKLDFKLGKNFLMALVLFLQGTIYQVWGDLLEFFTPIAIVIGLLNVVFRTRTLMKYAIIVLLSFIFYAWFPSMLAALLGPNLSVVRFGLTGLVMEGLFIFLPFAIGTVIHDWILYPEVHARKVAEREARQARRPAEKAEKKRDRERKRSQQRRGLLQGFNLVEKHRARKQAEKEKKEQKAQREAEDQRRAAERAERQKGQREAELRKRRQDVESADRARTDLSQRAARLEADARRQRAEADKIEKRRPVDAKQAREAADDLEHEAARLRDQIPQAEERLAHAREALEQAEAEPEVVEETEEVVVTSTDDSASQEDPADAPVPAPPVDMTPPDHSRTMPVESHPVTRRVCDAARNMPEPGSADDLFFEED